MTQTGKRVAEMHVALASRDDIADFSPEPVTRFGHRTFHRSPDGTRGANV